MISTSYWIFLFCNSIRNLRLRLREKFKYLIKINVQKYLHSWIPGEALSSWALTLISLWIFKKRKIKKLLTNTDSNYTYEFRLNLHYTVKSYRTLKNMWSNFTQQTLTLQTTLRAVTNIKKNKDIWEGDRGGSVKKSNIS